MTSRSRIFALWTFPVTLSILVAALALPIAVSASDIKQPLNGTAGVNFSQGGNAASVASVTASAIRQLTGFTSNTLAANDDGSAPTFPIGFPINFFGQNFSNVYVNNNGNLTFTGSLGTYTPFNLNTTSTPIIAPFFADVDTRGVGSGLVQYGNATVDGFNAFGANYINVGYFGSHTDKLNSFQVILISHPEAGTGSFDIEFNYNSILWETGDASGGTGGLGGSPVRVGFSNGSTAPGTSFELPGSGQTGAFLDSNTNTGLTSHSRSSTVLGRYIFQVRGGVPGIPGCASLTGGNGVCTGSTGGTVFSPAGNATFTFNIGRLTNGVGVLISTNTPGVFVLQICTTRGGAIIVLFRGRGGAGRLECSS